MDTLQLSASEFKAKCLDILDRIGRGELESVVVTKRGRPVARVVAPPAADPPGFWHGAMQGSFTIASGVDLTEPAYDEPWEAERPLDGP